MLKPLHWLLSLIFKHFHMVTVPSVQGIKRYRDRFLTLGDKGPTGIITRRGKGVSKRKFAERANVVLVLKTFTSMNLPTT